MFGSGDSRSGNWDGNEGKWNVSHAMSVFGGNGGSGFGWCSSSAIGTEEMKVFLTMV